MKYQIAILALVGAGLVCKVNAVTFSSVERFWTAMPDNSWLYTPNQSEPSQDLQVKKEINSDSPIMLTAEITNTDTGSVAYSDKDLNICTRYDDSLKRASVRLFNRSLFGKRKTTCPVSPQTREIYRYQYDLLNSAELSPGHYEIAYTATDNGELVFSTLKFRFTVDEPTSFWG